MAAEHGEATLTAPEVYAEAEKMVSAWHMLTKWPVARKCSRKNRADQADPFSPVSLPPDDSSEKWRVAAPVSQFLGRDNPRWGAKPGKRQHRRDQPRLGLAAVCLCRGTDCALRHLCCSGPGRTKAFPASRRGNMAASAVSSAGPAS